MSVYQSSRNETADLIIGGTSIGERDLIQNSARLDALASRDGGTISSFLAPLTQDTFKQVVKDVEYKLQIVNQTLSMLDSKGFEAILQEMLQSITLKTGELLGADRTT